MNLDGSGSEGWPTAGSLDPGKK